VASTSELAIAEGLIDPTAMPSDAQRREALKVMTSLEAVDDCRLREAIVEALRNQCRPPDPISRARVVEDVLGMVTSLSPEQRRETADGFNGLYAAFVQHRGHAPLGENRDVRRVEVVLWEFISRGLFYPRFGALKDHGLALKDKPHGIAYLIPTPLGERFLRERRLHPSMPDFVPRAVAGIGDLPPEVKTALEDAQQCFHNRLLRASVVMLGLAFEAMASEIFDVVVGGTKPPLPRGILDKIAEAVRRSRNEEGSRVVLVAEQIRVERNEAAHQWALDFSDYARVEGLLILGGRNVAPFWALRG